MARRRRYPWGRGGEQICGGRGNPQHCDLLRKEQETECGRAVRGHAAALSGGHPIQVRQGSPLKQPHEGLSSHHNSSHLLGPARHQGRNRGETPSSLAPKSASVAASQATSSISARSQPLRNSSEGCADGLPPDVIDDEVYSVLSVVDEGCVAGLRESDDQGELEGQGVVVGSLARCKPFWETMGASEFVLRIICEGYLLPFVQLPRPKTVKNHSSAQCQFDFVTDSIRDLMERGCIKEVKSEEAMICNPLGVVNNGKKLRLILDLRYVNTYLAKFKFKMEDLKTVARVYEKGDYVITFDLKSGYHHIEIAQEHQNYLGFKWFNAEGTITTYVFCVLPFGLSTAPYVFTKVTRVLLRRWRELGIRCQLYMDDGSFSSCCCCCPRRGCLLLLCACVRGCACD